jgi:hypothetical protein
MSATIQDARDLRFTLDAFASLAVRLAALRAGNCHFSVRFRLGLEHPVGAMARALDDLASSVRAERERRARRERELEARLERIERERLLPIVQGEIPELPADVVPVPVIGACEAARAEETMAELRSLLGRTQTQLVILNRFRASAAHRCAAIEAAFTTTPSRTRHPGQSNMEHR